MYGIFENQYLCPKVTITNRYPLSTQKISLQSYVWHFTSVSCKQNTEWTQINWEFHNWKICALFIVRYQFNWKLLVLYPKFVARWVDQRWNLILVRVGEVLYHNHKDTRSFTTKFSSYEVLSTLKIRFTVRHLRNLFLNLNHKSAHTWFDRR